MNEHIEIFSPEFEITQINKKQVEMRKVTYSLKINNT